MADINSTLMPEKQNEVGRIILDAGFNIHDFHWATTIHHIPDSTGMGYGGTGIICSMLEYRGSKEYFYFKFIFYGKNFFPEFSPGTDLQRVVKVVDTSDWGEMLEMFKGWLLFLRKQLSAKDLWSEVIDFREQYFYKDLDYGKNVHFNENEKILLREELNNIELKILETFELLDAQRQYIKSGFLSVHDKIDKLDKTSWRLFYIGFIVDLGFFLTSIASDNRIPMFIRYAYHKIMAIIAPHIQKLLG